MTQIDQTHDPELKSWVASASGHSDFPLQNLPLGIFYPADGKPRAGIAIVGACRAMILPAGQTSAASAKHDLATIGEPAE